MGAGNVLKHVGWAYFFLAVITIGLQLLISGLMKLAGVYAGDSGVLSLLISLAPMYLIAMPVCVRVLQEIPRKEIYQNPLSAGRWIRFLFMCIFVMIAGNLIGNVVSMLLSNLTGADLAFDLQNMLMGERWWVTLLFTVILAPVLEEFVFRKALIDRAIVLGDRAAILLSGFLFGVFHGNFHQFFYAFGIGCMLAYLYIRTGRIRNTISLHMVINFAGGFLPTLILGRLDLGAWGNLQEMVPGDAYLYLLRHIGPFLMYAVYVLCIFGAAIAGLVLFILSVKKTVLRPGEYSMPAPRMLRAAFGNPGMLLYCAACVLLFVMDLLPG